MRSLGDARIVSRFGMGGWLKSPEGTAPEVRNAPNRGRRRASAGIKEPEGDEQKYFLVIP